MNASRLLIGKALKNDAIKDEKLNVLWGLPILASDAISSVAYAGEEILWVLIPILGLMSYRYMFYSAICIVLLMSLLVLSYKQIIDLYPNGGGAYVVASENLGKKTGLVAASALIIDYILTVAVSSSAGTAAITSALPSLMPYRVIITLIIILFITLGNLRGVRESSKLFGIPTYLFIISIIILIVSGITKVLVFGYVPTPIYEIPNQIGDITLLLFLKAFASGCTALTGVEAVSNGVPNFKNPAQKNAKNVLYLLGLCVLLIFGGLSYLSTLYHAVPSTSQTILSQISLQVFGHTFMYYIIQVTTAIILIMAANTAFAGLPLLLALMAKDGFVPRQLSKRGKRLSFSNGIILISLSAMILVILFKGETHLLLPLYAVGVFISFTLSQVGMLVKWKNYKIKGLRHKAVINGIGAIVTFFTAIIIAITKFVHGAWIVCIIIPILVCIMLKVKEHYSMVAKQLKLSIDEAPESIGYTTHKKYIIIPIDTLNKSFLKAFNYAKSISDNIIVFHVSYDEEATKKLLDKWDSYNLGIDIVVKNSPYRELLKPLVNYVDETSRDLDPKDTISIVIPQFVVGKWWGKILHNQTAFFLKTMLLRKPNVAIITIPYIINEN